MNKKKMENKGFTLVELIVVLVILAILAAILVPALL
ncbi:MAG: prepilin-type N-terminal cleavage/methylation domain-containing protein, partial [Lachnospiraceae bacterium]|nr:prepilin-type N-terminal cleavage/methylation domain-containing protein [Lachnospiraceae bacterium]